MGARDSDEIEAIDGAERELGDVEQALRRLDEGTYADCEVCGRAIGDDRLAESPVTRRCSDHAVSEAPGASTGA
ncbi:MAG: TraR/DksA C4-type zinc finger protein [Acidimicrobiales bacterium]